MQEIQRSARWLAAVAAAICASWAAPGSLAQSYPTKPIRIVAGFPAGSGVDFIARTVGQRLSGFLGQPVVVENRSGAAGTRATGVVAAAVPDGYTLLQVERLRATGSVPMHTTPEQFGGRIEAQMREWGRILRAANVKPE